MRTKTTTRETYLQLLAFLRKHQETPIDVLERIFLETVAQVELFDRFSIMEINPSFYGEKRVCIVVVNDLLLYVARHLAKKDD